MTETLPEPSASTGSIAELMALREMTNVMDRLRALKAKNGLAFYKPHEKQIKFHCAAARRRYVRTGNRWGKSTAGAAEDISWCMGERIFFPESHPGRSCGIPKRSVKGVLICSDWSKAEEIFTSQASGAARGKIFQLAPEASIAGIDKTNNGEIGIIHFRSKWGGTSSLYIDTVKSFKSNPLGHESSDWDFIHVDEPLPQSMWEAYARGLIDRHGSAWFMCTPLEELWINDRFIPNGRLMENFPDGEDFDDCWVMTGSTSDNPHVTAEALLTMTKDTRPEELEARLHGRPRQFAGIIHKCFDRNVHVYSHTPHGWASPTDPPRDWLLRTSIDPHWKIPHAALNVATGPLGHSFIFSEAFVPGSIDHLCEVLHASWASRDSMGGYKMQPFAVTCDPLAWTPNPVSGITMADAFYQNNVPVLPGSKDLAYAIIRTEDLFAARDALGNPMIFIHESCRNLLYELDRYIWDSNKESPKANQSDHLIECLHRLVMMDLTYLSSNVRKPQIRPLDLNRTNFSMPGYSPKKKPAYLATSTRYPV